MTTPIVDYCYSRLPKEGMSPEITSKRSERMKIIIASLVALTTAGIAVPSLTQDKRAGASVGSDQQDPKRDQARLYALVKAARKDVREMRIQAGLHAHAAGPHIDPKGHHANDSAAQRKRERGEKEGHEDSGREGGGERGHEGGREGRGEHGGRKSREGRGEHGGEGRKRGEKGHSEESGKRIRKLAKHDKTYKNGARLTLQYNPNTEAFVGSVKNTTRKTLSQVRVEIHLSNGLELGPTLRIDLKPGATTPVELSALDQKFSHWVTHPEAGVEEGHGPGGEESKGHAEREKGEHGAGGGDEGSGEHSEKKSDKRPSASHRPVYNQLQLLRGEIKAFKADLAAKKQKKI